MAVSLLQKNFFCRFLKKYPHILDVFGHIFQSFFVSKNTSLIFYFLDESKSRFSLFSLLILKIDFQSSSNVQHTCLIGPAVYVVILVYLRSTYFILVTFIQEQNKYNQDQKQKSKKWQSSVLDVRCGHDILQFQGRLSIIFTLMYFGEGILNQTVYNIQINLILSPGNHY